jgi:hypothetical protein
MILDSLKYLVIFLSVFATLSLIQLLVNFIKALLSTPPQQLSLERGALIYYGVCISFLATIIINNLI